MLLWKEGLAVRERDLAVGGKRAEAVRSNFRRERHCHELGAHLHHRQQQHTTATTNDSNNSSNSQRAATTAAIDKESVFAAKERRINLELAVGRRKLKKAFIRANKERKRSLRKYLLNEGCANATKYRSESDKGGKLRGKERGPSFPQLSGKY